MSRCSSDSKCTQLSMLRDISFTREVLTLSSPPRRVSAILRVASPAMRRWHTPSQAQPHTVTLTLVSHSHPHRLGSSMRSRAPSSTSSSTTINSSWSLHLICTRDMMDVCVCVYACKIVQWSTGALNQISHISLKG